MKRFYIISALIIFSLTNIKAQYSFDFLVSSPVSERIIDLIEEETGSFLAVGYEGEINPQEEDFVGLIIRISKEGDFIVKRYFDVDTGYIFRKIVKSYDNQYYVFGSVVHAPEYTHDLLVLKIDASLNVIWKKTYSFSEQWHFPMKVLPVENDGFHLISWIIKDNIDYAHFCRLNKDCDTIRSRTIYEFGSNKVRDAVYSTDSSQLYLFGTGYGSGAGSRVVFDTNYNFIYNDLLPELAGGNMQAKWISDSTLLFAAKYPNSDPGPQRDDIGISETDTSFSNMNIHLFGAVDTVDYPADVNIIDFKTPDSVFMLGTHNIIFDIWPHEVSWISLRQLDRNLFPRAQQLYGGDAYYIAFTLLSTSDGGCLISAERYDYHVQDEEYDVYIIKLSREDIITGTSSKVPEKSSSLLIYPNPAINEIYISNENRIAQYDLTIYNQTGQIVLHKYNATNKIDISILEEGMYIIELITKKMTKREKLIIKN